MTTPIKRFGEFSGFTATSLTNKTTPTISSVFNAVNTGCVLLKLVLTGTITNTSIKVSVGLVDDDDMVAWFASQQASVKTMPDTTKVADIIVCDTFRAKRLVVALEDAITGGGNVTVQYSFAIPTL